MTAMKNRLKTVFTMDLVSSGAVMKKKLIWVWNGEALCDKSTQPGQRWAYAPSEGYASLCICERGKPLGIRITSQIMSLARFNCIFESMNLGRSPSSPWN